MKTGIVIFLEYILSMNGLINSKKNYICKVKNKKLQKKKIIFVYINSSCYG